MVFPHRGNLGDRRPIRPVAHTPRPDSDDWDDLAEHLIAVATIAEGFADAFGAGDLAFLIGLWHDLGKYNPAFQDYLWACHLARQQQQLPPRRSIPHAIWGAAFAYKLLIANDVDQWYAFGLPVKGHHAGLSCSGTAASELLEFIDRQPEALRTMGKAVVALADKIEHVPSPRLQAMDAGRKELFVRMLFSALVDADRLATEAFCHPENSAKRQHSPTLESLWAAFSESQPKKARQSATVRRIREEVYAALGQDAVLEHHSALDLPDDEHEDEAAVRRRLATENWDAPIIVTTTVQLFESLFTDRPGKARKLHRLAKSVIILDEVQAFPPELLQPTLDVLRLLATPVDRGGYGATVVLSTATQPAFAAGPLADLVDDQTIAEIVPNYAANYADLRRVTYEVRSRPCSWSDLAAEIRNYAQTMVVLNTRRDALALLDALGDDPDLFHLSSLLCGAHRRDILNEIEVRLKEDKPIRLISTQVVECGVDLDFPVVYRAIGPLDRIVQAAGRCNRNWNRPVGTVVVFTPGEGSAPRGPYQAGLETARFLLNAPDAKDLHDPALYREYFQRLFQKIDVDKRKIQPARAVLDYPEVGRKYRLIDSDTSPVVVPYGQGWKQRLRDWRNQPSRRAWQRLQPYLVNLYRHEIQQKSIWLEQIEDDLYRCLDGGYDATSHRGFVGNFRDPSDLVIGGE